VKGATILLGNFVDKDDAIAARADAEHEHFGQHGYELATKA
jgi:hypothetical protein